MKNLQETLTKYLEKTSLENITIESILSTFKDVNVQDEDTNLYLSHALVNMKYEEDKVCKMLQILFENGLDPNKKGFAEYTFLHIALYGAETEKKETLPYPLSFFERVIPLAKKYGFDVNSKDEDGDTLIHTAIYSEDYFDRIEPLIRLLGKNFDLSQKNKQKETILDSLNTSIEEATNTKNKSWLQQLKKEQKLISSIIKATEDQIVIIPEYKKKNVTISDYLDINAFKKLIGEQIENLISSFEAEEAEKITMEATSKTCKKLRERISISKLTEEEKETFLKKLKESQEKIVGVIQTKLEEKINMLTIDSSLKECEEIQAIISQSYLPIEIVEELGNRVIILIEKINQQLLIKQLKESVQNIETVKDIEDCLKRVEEIKNTDFKQEMMEELNGKLQEATKRLEHLKATFRFVKNLLILDSSYFGNTNYKEGKRSIYKDLDLKQIEEEEIEALAIGQFDLYEESLTTLSEEIIDKLKTRFTLTISKELEKAETIDHLVGTHILKELGDEINKMLDSDSINPNNGSKKGIPKQKKKK